MTEATSYDETILGFVAGDPGAALFIRQVFLVAHAWDDLIDRDRVLADAEIMRCFWTALIDLPVNEFYRRHFAVLHPILLNAIVNWVAATTLERQGNVKDKSIAFILRASYIDLLTMAAILAGGRDWGLEVAPEIRRWAHAENFGEYLDNLKKEREANL